MNTIRWGGCRTACLLAAVTLSGCATYSDSFDVVQRNLAKHDYDAALHELEQQAHSKKDRALYLLNKGMVLRMKHEFAASNEALEAAKNEMERLHAASLSENALSFVVNDATVSYAGDDFEQVLVHLYMALNYLELGQLDEARVEALQVDIKLREIGENIPDNKFTEDALSRYLTGLIYDERGEWSDAMIAYRKAYEAYQQYQQNYGLPIPEMLKHDLLRLTQKLGLSEELARYKEEFGIEPPLDLPEQQGELVFVLNNGLAPVKREKIAGATGPAPTIVVDAASHKRVTPAPPVAVNIALPYYESRQNEVATARLSISGKQVYTETMEDIDAIARASLDARMPAITARSIARAVAKVAIQESVDRIGRSRDDDVAVELLNSFFVRVAAIATERADTRSWLTLPANIQLARLPLPPGRHNATVELLSEDGRIVAVREFPDLEVGAGRKTYLTQHWIPESASTTRRRK